MRTGSDDRGWWSISVVIFSVSISLLDPVLSANLISFEMRKAMVSDLYPFKSMVGFQLIKYSYNLSAYIRANYIRVMNFQEKDTLTKTKAGCRLSSFRVKYTLIPTNYIQLINVRILNLSQLLCFWMKVNPYLIIGLKHELWRVVFLGQV